MRKVNYTLCPDCGKVISGVNGVSYCSFCQAYYNGQNEEIIMPKRISKI